MHLWCSYIIYVFLEDGNKSCRVLLLARRDKTIVEVWGLMSAHEEGHFVANHLGILDANISWCAARVCFFFFAVLVWGPVLRSQHPESKLKVADHRDQEKHLSLWVGRMCSENAVKMVKCWRQTIGRHLFSQGKRNAAKEVQIFIYDHNKDQVYNYAMDVFKNPAACCWLQNIAEALFLSLHECFAMFLLQPSELRQLGNTWLVLPTTGIPEMAGPNSSISRWGAFQSSQNVDLAQCAWAKGFWDESQTQCPTVKVPWTHCLIG